MAKTLESAPTSATSAASAVSAPPASPSTTSSSPSIYTVSNLAFSYGKTPVFRDLSFAIARGKITALMGINGSGKSTLFKLLTKNLRPHAGEIALDGRALTSYHQGELARKVAVVWQHNTAPYDITVRQLVSYGRIPHRHHFQSATQADNDIVDEALLISDLTALADRRVQDLSGGQAQRVWIALGLAQQTPVMFLDEPTTFLDIRYQIKIVELIARLNHDLQKTIVLILHDINQVLNLCDEIIALGPDETILQGNPQDLIDEDFLHNLYDTKLHIGTFSGEKVVFAPSNATMSL